MLRVGWATLRSVEPSLRYGYEPTSYCGFKFPPSPPFKKPAPGKGAGFLNGGEGGIRTHGTLASTPHFECGAFDHSATSPSRFPGSSNTLPEAICVRRSVLQCTPNRAPEPSKGGSLRICAGNRKLFSQQSQPFFEGSRPSFRGKRGFFPPLPGQHCGKQKATTLNFYRWIGSLQPNMKRFPAAWLSGVSPHQSREKAHIFNQRHIWVLCKTATESYVAV